jgi:3,4-dihydroxy 2-butanone 4-phosphate synthase/GTP cyclohydrolase II
VASSDRAKLISNNPQKRVGLLGYGLEIIEQIPIEIAPNPHNVDYLTTKRDKMGHTILKK